MIVRIAVACLLSLFCAVGFIRSLSSTTLLPVATPESPNKRNLTFRTVCLLLCALWSVTWLAIAAIRFRYPYELEWIGGAMRDHCMRVVSDQPLYVPHDSGWFPYEYPPLYFWVSALLMKLSNDYSFSPMRAVSIASTIGTCAIAFLWVKRLISSWVPADKFTNSSVQTVWGAIAAGMFLASYRFVGDWYDAERLDMLFIFLSVAGMYWLTLALESKTDTTAAKTPQFRLSRLEYTLLSAAALTLSFFTKQQAILFVFSAVAALAWRHQYRSMAVFGVTVATGIGGGIAIINRATHNWFTYYCFKVPLTNGIKVKQAIQFLISDVPHFAPCVACVLIAMYVLRKDSTVGDKTKLLTKMSDAECIFAVCFAAGILGSWISRAHWGGDENVLIAAYLFIIMAACVAAGRLELRSVGNISWIYMLAISQMIVLSYRPDKQIPTAANYAAGANYAHLIDNLQREGEVLCIDHGGLTTISHFQTMALADVMGTEMKLPDSIAAAFKHHRYAVIITDADPVTSGQLKEALVYYPTVEKLSFKSTWVVTGFPTPSPLRSVYVMRK